LTPDCTIVLALESTDMATKTQINKSITFHKPATQIYWLLESKVPKDTKGIKVYINLQNKNLQN